MRKPRTAAGRALLAAAGPDWNPLRAILAIENEAAASPVLDALRWLIDHSTPAHSATCAGQPEDDPCICGVSEKYEQILTLSHER